MTTKSDPFTTSENPLGAISANWTTVTAAGLKDVNPGAIASSGSTQDNVSAWATGNYSFLADQTSEITVGATGAADWPGVAVRLSTASGGQGYVAYYIPEITQVSLYLLTAGTVGAAGSYILTVPSTSLASGDKLKLGAVGTTLTLYKNGVSMGSVTDSTYSSGQPGVAYEFGNANASIITGWTGTDAASASKAPYMDYALRSKMAM